MQVFGFMHHTYAGDLAATAFEIRTSTRGVADVTADDLVNLPEDTLIEFIR